MGRIKEGCQRSPYPLIHGMAAPQQEFYLIRWGNIGPNRRYLHPVGLQRSQKWWHHRLPADTSRNVQRIDIETAAPASDRCHQIPLYSVRIVNDHSHTHLLANGGRSLHLFKLIAPEAF